MLPNPIPYSESESLSLQQRILFLASCFLMAFSSLSIFLLNRTKDCLAEFGFFPPFLVVRKLDFSVPSFSNQQQSLVLCLVCVPPCFMHRLQCFLVQVFLGTLAVVSVPGCLLPCFLLCKAFLLGEALDLSWLHTRSIALRDERRKRMSMGVIPFLWRLNWSYHVYGHIQRTWLARSASAKDTFMGIIVAFMLGRWYQQGSFEM